MYIHVFNVQDQCVCELVVVLGQKIVPRRQRRDLLGFWLHTQTHEAT